MNWHEIVGRVSTKCTYCLDTKCVFVFSVVLWLPLVPLLRTEQFVLNINYLYSVRTSGRYVVWLQDLMWRHIFQYICGLTARFNVTSHIPIYIQQDATLHSLFISGNCPTCFGWYLHPSSGAHTTVSTASGICHNVTATRRYCGGVGTTLSVHTQSSSGSFTTAAGSSNGVTYTRCCRYSCMRSWWWVEVPPETCRAVYRYK